MKRIGLLIMWVLPVMVTGQDLPVYSQYLLNPFLYNPSLAGVSTDGIAQTTSRIQWIGIPDAPRVNTISYHQGFDQMGIGGYIYSDKNGLNSETGIKLSGAYHLDFSRYKNEIKRISGGLSISGFQFSVDESKFTDIENDPAVTGAVQSRLSFNVSTGINLVINGFFAGISVANLIPNSYRTSSSFEPVTPRNYFLGAGYSIPIQKNFIIEPSIVFKSAEMTSSQIDINLKTKYISKEYAIWIALSFRRILEASSQQNLSFMPVIGYETGVFSFGYGYEYGLSAIQAQNSGTHEIMVGYRICPKKGCPAQLF
jgi:type IX secretion system PorP/SprF family membrane protein